VTRALSRKEEPFQTMQSIAGKGQSSGSGLGGVTLSSFLERLCGPIGSILPLFCSLPCIYNPAMSM
jgi:hypothetical protein